MKQWQDHLIRRSELIMYLLTVNSKQTINRALSTLTKLSTAWWVNETAAVTISSNIWQSFTVL